LEAKLTAQKNICEKLHQKIKSKLESDKNFKDQVTEAFKDIFTANQVDLILSKKKSKRWESKEVAKALAIYNCSSSCYEYLREQLNYPIPCKRTVLRWSSRIHIQPGLIKPVLAVLKDEFQTFTPMQRQAVLCFDEVSIDSLVSLEQKHQVILGLCKNMMGIYTRGLFHSWKQIIYFDFDLRLTKELINSIIEALHDAGVNIVGLISDMCTINVRVWNELGIDIKHGIYFNSVLFFR